jgi:hypothetical protein
MAEIDNRDYWIKVVGMLEQNWALISDDQGKTTVYFFNDRGDVFDHRDFYSGRDAEKGLRRNGFSRYAADKKIQEFVAKPGEPISVGGERSNPIYSSGEYWK